MNTASDKIIMAAEEATCDLGTARAVLSEALDHMEYSGENYALMLAYQAEQVVRLLHATLTLMYKAEGDLDRAITEVYEEARKGNVKAD